MKYIYIFLWLSIGIESQAWENKSTDRVYWHVLFNRLFWRSANSGANFIMNGRVRRRKDIFTSCKIFADRIGVRTNNWLALVLFEMSLHVYAEWRVIEALRRFPVNYNSIAGESWVKIDKRLRNITQLFSNFIYQCAKKYTETFGWWGTIFFLDRCHCKKLTKLVSWILLERIYRRRGKSWRIFIEGFPCFKPRPRIKIITRNGNLFVERGNEVYDNCNSS